MDAIRFHENSTRENVPRGLLSVSRKQRAGPGDNGFNANDEKYHTCCGAHVTSCARFFLGLYIFGMSLDLLREYHHAKLIVIPIIIIGVVGVCGEQRYPLIAFIVIDTLFALGLAVVTVLGLWSPSTPGLSQLFGNPAEIFNGNRERYDGPDNREQYRQQENRGHGIHLQRNDATGWSWNAHDIVYIALTVVFWAFLILAVVWKYLIFWKMAEYLKDKKAAIKYAGKYREPAYAAAAERKETGEHPAYGESEMEAAQKVIDYHSIHDMRNEHH